MSPAGQWTSPPTASTSPPMMPDNGGQQLGFSLGAGRWQEAARMKAAEAAAAKAQQQARAQQQQQAQGRRQGDSEGSNGHSGATPESSHQASPSAQPANCGRYRIEITGVNERISLAQLLDMFSDLDVVATQRDQGRVVIDFASAEDQRLALQFDGIAISQSRLNVVAVAVPPGEAVKSATRGRGGTRRSTGRGSTPLHTPEHAAADQKSERSRTGMNIGAKAFVPQQGASPLDDSAMQAGADFQAMPGAGFGMGGYGLPPGASAENMNQLMMGHPMFHAYAMGFPGGMPMLGDCGVDSLEAAADAMIPGSSPVPGTSAEERS
eukprot:TRINITY_DN2128_c4_g1_i1.p2 TRINITY_DN2128_c4_g1~~TRINITY_DN2128_c4_g1_i1.p2  ORF type:complete len:380 (+),score=103.67 TRINITY_DN2128_c4_g1_i1:173-1141(+)